MTVTHSVQACTSLNESSNIQTGAPPPLASSPQPPTKAVVLQLQAHTQCLRYGTEILNRVMYFGIARGIRLYDFARYFINRKLSVGGA